MLPLALFSLGFVLPLVHGASVPREPSFGHVHQQATRTLPTSWVQERDHPAYALFRRDAPGDGTDYPTVGSSTWYAAYPSSTADPSQYPPEWVAALNAAVSAGLIPDVPVSTNTPADLPVYPNNEDPTSPDICSATYKCRNEEYDIWDAPDGVIGIGFDDGPLPYSPTLYQFLANNSQRATHFMIGVNILNNPDEFLEAFETNGDDIAVHTWTHPYMTTLTNEQLLGEFGWTMEIIHNSTGGRLPRYWRPPYGDADNRVRAIAKEVFGLTTIVWNQDTEDWSLGEAGGTTPAVVASSLQQWITGAKSPGLIILEHELSDEAVQAFIAAYPTMKQNGWNTTSTAELYTASAWYNADSSTAPVTPADILAEGALSNSTVGAPSSTTSSAASTSASVALTTSTSRSAGAAAATASGKTSGARTVGGDRLYGALMSTAAMALVFVLLG